MKLLAVMRECGCPLCRITYPFAEALVRVFRAS